jgi:hypothetical protein
VAIVVLWSLAIESQSVASAAADRGADRRVDVGGRGLRARGVAL